MHNLQNTCPLKPFYNYSYKRETFKKLQRYPFCPHCFIESKQGKTNQHPVSQRLKKFLFKSEKVHGIQWETGEFFIPI